MMDVAKSTRDGLAEIFKEVDVANTLLGKDRPKGNSSPSRMIEYESLLLGESEEAARLRMLNLNLKGSTGTESTGSRLPYKNINMWSSRSIALEQMLKPFVTANIKTWPDFETLNKIATNESGVELLNKLDLGLVDTLMVRLKEANERRYGLERLCSPWSFTSAKFEITKVRGERFGTIRSGN
jgi:hypothetical protein